MKHLLLSVALALSPAFVSAADTCEIVHSESTVQACQLTETAQMCRDRINTGSSDPDNSLDLANTGDSGNSAVNDFLPLLRLLLDNGEIGEDQQTIGFEWSNPLHFDPKLQNKIGVTLQRPEVYEPLKQALTAASLADEASTLEKSIDARDDLTITLNLGYASKRFGRDPRLHRSDLSSLIAPADAVDPAQFDALERLRTFERANGLDRSRDKPLCNTPEALRGEHMRLALAEILAGKASLRGFVGRLKANGFYGVLDLIGNQPQLTFAASYRSRTEAAGPNEFKATLSFEMGGKNYNDYVDSCGGAGDPACLASYLGRDKNSEDANTSRRIRFFADYTKIARLTFAMPQPGFTFLTEPSERLSVNGTYGQYLGKETLSGQRSRIDASLAYEDFSDDPLRQDRGVATVTLTYPFMEGFYLSLGAVYATKPQFRGDVDREIGARAGVTYKIVEN